MSTGAGLPEVRALLVVESVFGNTAAIGRAIAEGMREHATVDVVAVDAAPADLPEGLDLLVVGAPTHAFTLSRPGSRQDARMRREVQQVEVEQVAEGTGRRAVTTSGTVGTGDHAIPGDTDPGGRVARGDADGADGGHEADGADGADDADGGHGADDADGGHEAHDAHEAGARSERTPGPAPEAGATADGRGVREWLGVLPARVSKVAAATFDTKIARPRLPGSAAAAIAKRLRRRGFRLVARPRSFYVTGTEGPLVHGEIERAREWGRQVGAASLRLEQPR